MKTAIYAETSEQRDAVLELVHWFDNEYTSLYHALIKAAERNDADAQDPEVLAMPPAVSGHLMESGQRWRAIADRVLALGEKLGDTEELMDTNTQH